MSPHRPAAPTSREAPRDPLIGRVLAGRFRILGLVARGGMGKIYRAEQRPLGRVVALKVLAVDRPDDEEFRRRFFREAAVCSKLGHPNTVRIFDYGQTEDDVFFIAMEYLDGATLQEILRAEGALGAERVVHVARQVCGSLAEAHAAEILHRDLKPSNILLTQHGDDEEFVKVVDFGLVKDNRDEHDTTGGDYVLGSPLYMSPEQVQARDRLTAASDIYSLGCVMYTALAGRPPFQRDNALSLLMSHIHSEPPTFAEANPAVRIPRVLEWVVMTCLEKDPTKRFSSANELGRALRLCEADLRGHVSADLDLRLSAGRLQLPADVEDSLRSRSMRRPAPATAAADLPSSTSLLRTLGPRAMPLWAVAALGFLFVVLTLVVGAGAMVAVGAWAVGQRDLPAATSAPATAAGTPAAPPTAEAAPAEPGTAQPADAPANADNTSQAPRTEPANPPSSALSRDNAAQARPGGAGTTGSPAPAAPAVTDPPDVEPVPKEEDWTQASDIRDPWGD